jgi:hypothetical protein
VSGSLATLVGLALRCCLLLLRREQQCDKAHRKENDCMCEPCQWIRGIEQDGDETLGRNWRE